MGSFFDAEDATDDIKDWNEPGTAKKVPSKAPVSKPTLPAQRPGVNEEEASRGLPVRKTAPPRQSTPTQTPRSLARPAPTTQPSAPIRPHKTPTSAPISRPSTIPQDEEINPREQGLQDQEFGMERQDFLENELKTLKQSHQDEKQDAEDKAEEQRSKGRGKGKRTKPAAKKKANGDNNYAGGRRNIVIVRWVIIGIFIVLAGLGIKAVVAPPEFPTPNQILGVVDKNLGYTAFPRDEGNTFVLGFAELYLNGPADANSNTARLEGLNRYAPSNIVDQMSTNYSNTDWRITEGPYINQVTYTDDSSALFNVAARVNEGLWIYIDVPVFYNKDTQAFAISGIPGIVAAPNLTEIPGWPTSWQADDDVLASTQLDLERFFQAWGQPGEYDLPAYSTTDASLAVKQGLNNGAIYQSIAFAEVSSPLDELNPTTSPREVRIEVVWGYPETSRPDEKGETAPSLITFKSTYSLLIFPASETNRWRVQDIKAGIRSTTGVLSSTAATASPSPS